jgi:transglutaminase-like putative cysteine protease
MTGQSAPARPGTDGADLRMSGLLLLALALAVTGMHSILTDINWWFAAFGVMLVVFSVAAVARYYLRRRWVGTAAALVAGLLVLTASFASGTALAGFIPTGVTFERFGNLSAAAGESIAQQSIPAIATPGIQFLVCWVIALIAVVMDGVAIWWRMPALTGIPLLIVVLVPSFVQPTQSDALAFELTAAAYLLIVLGRKRRVQPAIALSVGAIAVLGALAIPTVLPPVTPGGVNGSGVGVLAESINPIINLGADLRQSDPTPALSYTTTAPGGEYLRLTTLDNFSGSQWAPSTPKLDPKHSVASVGAPPGLTTAVKTASVSTSVQVADTTGAWLPVPYPTVTVKGLRGSWYWEPGTLAIRSSNTSMQGQRYTVDSLDVEPTVQQLDSAGSSATSALAVVPKGLDPIVAKTAATITAGAKTDFEKAVALQDWFRGGTFTYSTKTPAAEGFDGSGLDVIVPFLEAKSGYCVHFATTMAVMARTLGIPSRIAVGFLPGRATKPGDGKVTVYQVSSSNLHAWPELYFKGVGWVRFEPTPGRGFEPNFPNAPSLGNQTTPGTPASSQPTVAPTSTPVTAPKLPNQGDATNSVSALNSPAAVSTTSIGGLGGLLVLALILAPTIVRISIRRRRLDRIRQGIDPASTTWQELRESARDLGIDARSSLTPAELTLQLTGYLARAPRRTEEASVALAELRRLVEDEAFGPPDYRYFGEQMAEELSLVLKGLRAASPVANRVTATVVPPTLLDRVLGRSALRA